MKRLVLFFLLNCSLAYSNVSVYPNYVASSTPTLYHGKLYAKSLTTPTGTLVSMTVAHKFRATAHVYQQATGRESFAVTSGYIATNSPVSATATLSFTNDQGGVYVEDDSHDLLCAVSLFTRSSFTRVTYTVGTELHCFVRYGTCSGTSGVVHATYVHVGCNLYCRPLDHLREIYSVNVCTPTRVIKRGYIKVGSITICDPFGFDDVSQMISCAACTTIENGNCGCPTQ